MSEAGKQFGKKIYEEYRQFRESTLNQSKEDIYKDSYKIDVFVNLYEILIERSEQLSDAILENLLKRSGILELIYQRWLKKEDSTYDEIVQCVDEELQDSDIFEEDF